MSLDQFTVAWKKTGAAEAGYVNNPNDKGGETNHGITVVVARAHGYTGDMRDLTEDQAIVIAKSQYWDVMNLDDIADVSPAVAAELFDTGFLSGTTNAGLFMQKALNLFNREEVDYPDVVEDGHPGKVTAYTFKQYMAKRGADGERVMMLALNAQQGSFFMDLGRRVHTDEDFEFGWFLNRVSM